MRHGGVSLRLRSVGIQQVVHLLYLEDGAVTVQGFVYHGIDHAGAGPRN